MYRTFKRPFGLLMLLLILMLALVACGGNEGTQQESQSPNQTNESTNDSAQAKEPAQERVVKHAMGETKVPVNPERIVVLDNGALDNLLALNVKPTGAATVSLDEPFFSYLLDQTEGIEKVGTIDEPNLESIAAVKPDLILGSKDTHEAIYDKLTQIAPTVFTETLGVDWKGNLKIHAEALGKTDEANKLISDYEKRMDEFKTKMGDKLAKTEISILRPRADHVRIYLSESYSGQFIEEIGFPRPAAQQEKDFAKKATEEQIADLDGDVIFWFSRDTENILNTKLKNNPLWSTLKAVKENNVYEVSTETWLSGMGIQSRNLMLDDLFKYLIK